MRQRRRAARHKRKESQIARATEQQKVPRSVDKTRASTYNIKL
nr:MAG TPA: hypothetical protein [Caudoviricetes sp.]